MNIKSQISMVKELLEMFMYQNSVDKMVSKDGLILVYRVNNIVRIDIKILKECE